MFHQQNKNVIYFLSMGWDIVCLKIIASSVAHEVLMGDMLAEAQSCNSHLHHNLSKTLTSKTAVSRSCWGSIAEDVAMRAGILSVLFMDIHTPQSWEPSQVHSQHFNVCWMNTWKKSAPLFLIQTSSALGHRESRLGSMQRQNLDRVVPGGVDFSWCWWSSLTRREEERNMENHVPGHMWCTDDSQNELGHLEG